MQCQHFVSPVVPLSAEKGKAFSGVKERQVDEVEDEKNDDQFAVHGTE